MNTQDTHIHMSVNLLYAIYFIHSGEHAADMMSAEIYSTEETVKQFEFLPASSQSRKSRQLHIGYPAKSEDRVLMIYATILHLISMFFFRRIGQNKIFTRHKTQRAAVV